MKMELHPIAKLFPKMSAEWIQWNRFMINLQQLEKILKFELNPITLEPRTDRRHHALEPLPLFMDVGE